MSGDDVVFRGYKKDAEIALDVYMCLYTIGNQLGTKAYLEQKERTGTGKGAYNSFVAGFLAGVDEGMSVQCTALMIVVPKEVEDEHKVYSANSGKTKTRLNVSSATLYNRGKVEGREAVKSRGLEDKSR